MCLLVYWQICATFICFDDCWIACVFGFVVVLTVVSVFPLRAMQCHWGWLHVSGFLIRICSSFRCQYALQRIPWHQICTRRPMRCLQPQSHILAKKDKLVLYILLYFLKMLKQHCNLTHICYYVCQCHVGEKASHSSPFSPSGLTVSVGEDSVGGFKKGQTTNGEHLWRAAGHGLTAGFHTTTGERNLQSTSSGRLKEGRK